MSQQTGLTEKKPVEGGIGGTGIVGTLTDFGSLVINGLKVETDQATRVTDAFGEHGIETLAIGQNLTIEAETSEGQLVARRVHITHPVIGTVEQISADGRSAQIAGVPVDLESSAFGRLSVGERVAISGVWRGERIVASRVDSLKDPGSDALAGVFRTTPELGMTIGGRPVSIAKDTEPADGSFVTAIGRADQDGFIVEDLTVGRFTGAAGALSDLSVEGYLETADTAPFYAVSGLGHSFDPKAKLRPFLADRNLFTGRYVGTFAVEAATRLPEDLEQRRTIIREILAGGGSDLSRPAR
ncbi:MAG: DUF5666 domain-containing protein [Pseudomonadota bacterium]